MLDHSLDFLFGQINLVNGFQNRHKPKLLTVSQICLAARWFCYIIIKNDLNRSNIALGRILYFSLCKLIQVGAVLPASSSHFLVLKNKSAHI